MKTKKSQVFYSVNGCMVEGGACLSRGIFNTLKEAEEMAISFIEWEIWRHFEENGVRIENKLLRASFAFA